MRCSQALTTSRKSWPQVPPRRWPPSAGCTAAISTPCAEDLCIAHYEVVQVGPQRSGCAGRYHGRLRSYPCGTGTHRPFPRECGSTCRTAQPQPYLCSAGGSFHPAAGRAVQPDRPGAGARYQCSGCHPAGFRQAPRIFWAASSICWTGLSWTARWATSSTLLNDEEQAAGLIAPPAERSESVLLGEDLEPQIPGLCIVSDRYLVGGGLWGSIAIDRPHPDALPETDAAAALLCRSAGRGHERQTKRHPAGCRTPADCDL